MVKRQYVVLFLFCCALVFSTMAANASDGVSFQAARSFDAGNRPQSVALGDLNSDGISDLAVANNTSDNVSILLGNGDGTFRAKINYAAGGGTISIALGDLDSDIKLDLALANRYSDTVSIFINTTPPPTLPIVSDRSSGGICFITAGAHGNAMSEWFAVLQQFCRTVWGRRLPLVGANVWNPGLK